MKWLYLTSFTGWLKKNGPRVHLNWYLFNLLANCPYFTEHGRINDCEYTKTSIGAETKNVLR